MTEILWVNPVGSSAFDAETSDLVEAIRSPQFKPRIRHLAVGPPHLEYHLYEHAAFEGMLRLMREAQAAGCGAGIIGCFYDGGLRELREALDMPVVGMGEASVLLATTLGHRFSIIVGRRKWIPKMRDNVILTGVDRRLASFRSIEMSIPDMTADPDKFLARTLAECLKAVDHDGAEVIVLSELVPPALAARAARELPVPLLDPGIACWKWAEMAADLYTRLGLSHRRAFGFEHPPADGFQV